MVIRFGRHKGKDTSQVPDEDRQYLLWLSLTPWVWPELREAARIEYSARVTADAMQRAGAGTTQQRPHEAVGAPPAGTQEAWGWGDGAAWGGRTC